MINSHAFVVTKHPERQRSVVYPKQRTAVALLFLFLAFVSVIQIYREHELLFYERKLRLMSVPTKSPLASRTLRASAAPNRMESQFVQLEQMGRLHDGFYNNTDNNQIKKFEKSKPPTCFGGDIMSPWTRTPLYDERYFPQYSKISDFMEGLALRKPHPSAAVCEYRAIKLWPHFPHGMQQLYRCASWWLANPTKQPILLFGNKNGFYKSNYMKGFLEVLEKVIGLQIVKQSDGPVVIAKDTRKWEFEDFELTDSAMADPERKLRNIFASHILGEVETSCHSKRGTRFPRIAILNRNEESKRNLVNAEQIAAAIVEAFPNQITSVPIVYFEGKTFLEQAKFFLETDIVLSPHGAQLTSMAFLPQCAAVLEFFPKDYLVADYFGSLARAINISHSFFYLDAGFDNPETVLSYEKYHYADLYTRYKRSSFCPSVRNVTSAVIQMVNEWEDCCSMKAHVDSQSDARFATSAAVQSTISSIDIVAVDGPSAMMVLQSPISTLTQEQIFSAHSMVRNFFPITNDPDDADFSCSSEYIANFSSDLVLHQDYSGCRFTIQNSENLEEWLCAQKRLVNGLHHVLNGYRKGNVVMPDYLLFIQNDTYVNMDTLVETLQEFYTPEEPHLIAGCTNVLKKRKNYFVYPMSGFGSIMTRSAMEHMIQPIFCNNATKSSDDFVRWACWRLKQNYVGEQLLFEDGMSISQLMYVFFSKFPDMPVKQWNHTGYCFHRSDHTMAYFLNYYHISVPDWVLEATRPVDKVRKQYSYRKLAGSTEVLNRGVGGECDNMYQNCKSESRFCHPLSIEEMVQLQSQRTS